MWFIFHLLFGVRWLFVFLQETFVIEDCYYYNDGSSTTGLEIDSGVSCTSNGNYITITKSTSGEKYVWLPKQLTASDDYEYELEIAEIGSVQAMAINWNNTNDWAYYHNANGNWGVNNTNIFTTAIAVGDKFKIKKQGSTVTFYINEVLKHTLTKTYGNHKVGFYTNNGRTQKIKNIKLKAL